MASALRIPYFSQYVLVGPSPSTGQHFMDYLGNLNNNYDNLAANHNLLKQINRVQNISFSVEPNREEVRQLGTKSLVGRPAINAPKIELSFEYLLNGLANDARIGLNVNYAQFQYPLFGLPFYARNYEVDFLSGLYSREFVQPTGDPYWPYRMRDNRNIFLVRSPEGTEVQRLGEHRFDIPDTTRGIDPLAPQYEVMGFGNCYLNSYETSAAVNSIPKSKVSFSCENICFYTSGSGCNIPAINTVTRQPANQNKFNIPEIRNEGGPYILNPGDILLDISPSGFNDLTGLGINFRNKTITDYSISLDFNRNLLQSIGHKCPLDREINFPIIANLNFGIVVGALDSGNFIDILNIDSGYNVSIKLRNPLHNSPFPVINGPESTQSITGLPRHDGPAYALGDIAIRYDFLGALFNGVSFGASIGDNKRADLTFSVELNPDDLSKGYFVSGLLNIEKLGDYYLLEDGSFLIDENYNALVTNLVPLY